MSQYGSGIEPGLVINATMGITHRYDLTSFIVEETSSNCACVAVTLDTDTRPPQRHSDAPRALAGYKQNAGSSRIVTAFTTANREVVARYYSGDRVTFMHGKRVHNPSYHLTVPLYIRHSN